MAERSEPGAVALSPELCARLSRGLVVVAWATVDDAAMPHVQAGLLSQLGEEERARCQRFRFDEDRYAYVLAHALGRRLLGAATGIEPRRLCFAAGPAGKPTLVQAPGSRLEFNLSHTRGLVACAVSAVGPVGVDVERLGRHADIERLSQSVLSAAERERLDALDPDAKRDLFFCLWTLKESYVKALGTGLSTPLGSLDFTTGADLRSGRAELHSATAKLPEAGPAERNVAGDRRDGPQGVGAAPGAAGRLHRGLSFLYRSPFPGFQLACAYSTDALDVVVERVRPELLLG